MKFWNQGLVKRFHNESFIFVLINGNGIGTSVGIFSRRWRGEVVVLGGIGGRVGAWVHVRV